MVILDLCITNAWLLYTALIPHYEMQLVNFKLDVAQSLMVSRVADQSYVELSDGAKIHSARSVNETAKYDLVDHFPVRSKELASIVNFLVVL